MFDVDRDGVLSRDELHEMVVALLEVWKDNRTDLLPVSKLTLSHTRTQPSRAIKGELSYLCLLEPDSCTELCSGQSVLLTVKGRRHRNYSSQGFVSERGFSFSDSKIFSDLFKRRMQIFTFSINRM